MSRTTRADLDSLVRSINHRLELTDDEAREYTLDYQYATPMLVRARQSVSVSPRLRTGLMADWMRAFIAGMDVMSQSRYGIL